MEAGFIELLSILMSLSGFGVDANPNAPTSAEVMKYAPATADYMAYLDFEAIVPNNFRALKQLPNQPAIKSSPRALKAAKDLIAQAELGRSFLKGAAGIDPITDIKSVAAWIEFPDAGDPDAIVVVRGNFPADLLNRAAMMMGASAKTYSAGTAVPTPDGKELIGLTADGTLLFGTPTQIERRLKKNWRPRKHRKGSAGARFAKILADKPFYVLASSPSKRAIRRIEHEISAPEAAFLRDLLTGHKFAGVALFHNGIGWTWTDRSRAGYQAAVLASEGLIDLFRASHYGSRGFARVALAALGSYAGAAPEVDAILKYRDEILKLVTSMTGDGQFQVKVDKSAKGRTVSIKAWDQQLSDVIPVAGLMPALAAVGYLTASKSVGPQSAPVMKLAEPKRTKKAKKAKRAPRKKAPKKKKAR